MRMRMRIRIRIHVLMYIHIYICIYIYMYTQKNLYRASRVWCSVTDLYGTPTSRNIYLDSSLKESLLEPLHQRSHHNIVYWESSIHNLLFGIPCKKMFIVTST